jgi:site-specific DNA-cytosine methylase
MSPPCTPFAQRGALRDLDDPRSDAIKHVIQAVAAIQPPLVCLENVVGFETSHAFESLHERWTKVGYFIQTCILCPSSLGWPNRRPRVYCIASLTPQPALALPTFKAQPLSQFIDHSISPDTQPALWLDQETVDRYLDAMDRVSANDSAVTACFAASYGKAIVRSGSYLETETGYRRFSPREVARLLGFGDDFLLPGKLSVQRQWHLLGNSLSLPAVRHVLNGFLAEENAGRCPRG